MASPDGGMRSHAIDASSKANRAQEARFTKADNLLKQERTIDAVDLAKGGDDLSTDDLQLDTGETEVPWWQKREIAAKKEADTRTATLRDAIAKMPDTRPQQRPTTARRAA